MIVVSKPIPLRFERVPRETLIDLVERAWGVIANGGGGDWTKETAEWQAAATKWRDDFHAMLDVARGRQGR